MKLNTSSILLFIVSALIAIASMFGSLIFYLPLAQGQVFVLVIGGAVSIGFASLSVLSVRSEGEKDEDVQSRIWGGMVILIAASLIGLGTYGLQLMGVQ